MHDNLSKGMTIGQAINDPYVSPNPIRTDSYDPAARLYKPMNMIVREDPTIRLISVDTGTNSSSSNPDYPMTSNDPYAWNKVNP